MRRILLSSLLLLATSFSADAAIRVIVRTERGLLPLKNTCLLLGCNVVRSLDGALGKVFLLTVPDLLPLNLLQLNLSLTLGGISLELDTAVHIVEDARAGAPPAALADRSLTNYFGSPVWNGYANQPAAGIIRLAEARQEFGVDGAGVVAMIDTGVDRDHPALAGVLLPGYDFLNNLPQAADEKGDVTQSVSPVLDGGPWLVNSSTLAILNGLDLPLISALTSPPYRAFGHGTMVAGVVHMVAPRAQILPLRAFRKDGSGYLSDVIRAVYYAADQRANVLNMSFSFGSRSAELTRALEYASGRGTILVASAGNDGSSALVWPAASPLVMGVASTNHFDQRSSFSNFGPELVWVAAPGEDIVTTYPFNSYAAASGTSFSAPMVAGTVALLLDAGGNPTPQQAAAAIAHARYPSAALGNGRLDIQSALLAWTQSH